MHPIPFSSLPEWSAIGIPTVYVSAIGILIYNGVAIFLTRRRAFKEQTERGQTDVAAMNRDNCLKSWLL
jgi:hypothetical protein